MHSVDEGAPGHRVWIEHCVEKEALYRVHCVGPGALAGAGKNHWAQEAM